MSLGGRARRALRPAVRRLRAVAARVDAMLRPRRPWNGEHDPALLRFERWSGESDGRFLHDFLGGRIDPRFRPEFRADPAGPVRPDYPRPYASYFELVFVLESVLDAGERFTMMELGAGYGPARNTRPSV